MTATNKVCLPIVGGAESPCFPSATAFRSMGLYPFPLSDETPEVINSGKQPRFADWQALATKATEVQLRDWEARRWNLGLSLGPSRLVVLDSDTPEADAWAAQNLPPTPWITRTAKGHHRFFRLHEGVKAPSNRTRALACGIDRKAAGGYVVAPGSRHYSGVVYAAMGAWSEPIQSLPIYDPSWLPNLQRELVPHCLSNVHSSDALKRAVAYLLHVPPAIQGKGGDAHTYYVACILVRGFALPLPDALIAIGTWNEGCLPPWSIQDLRAKLHHASRYGLGSIGAMLASGGREW